MIVGNFIFLPHIILMLFHRFFKSFFFSRQPETFFVKIRNMSRHVVSFFQKCPEFDRQLFPLLLIGLRKLLDFIYKFPGISDLLFRLYDLSFFLLNGIFRTSAASVQLIHFFHEF